MSLNSTALPAKRALRIGIVQQGRIVHEQVFSESQRIRIGSDHNADIVLPPGQVPASRTLFSKRGNTWQLCLQSQDQGRIADGQVRDLAQRIASGDTEIPLDRSVKGKISLGEVTVLFQLVPAPGGAMQPGAFRPRLVDEDDPVFLGSLALISSAAAVLMVWVVQQEPVQRVTIEELPPQVVEMIFEQRDPPPEVEVVAQIDPEAPSTQVERVESLEPQPEREGPAAPENVEERRELAQQTVGQAMEALGIGTRGTSLINERILDRSDEWNDRVAAAIARSNGEVQTASMGPSVKTVEEPVLVIGPVDLDPTVTKNTTVTKGPGVGVRGTPPIIKDVVTSDSKALEKLLRRQMGPAVKRCYEQALNRSPSASGRIEVRVELYDGDVMETAMAHNDIDAEMGACLSRASTRWNFKDAEGTMVVPYVLTPSQ